MQQQLGNEEDLLVNLSDSVVHKHVFRNMKMELETPIPIPLFGIKKMYRIGIELYFQVFQFHDFNSMVQQKSLNFKISILGPRLKKARILFGSMFQSGS